MLLAEGSGAALALACSVPGPARSAGFVGVSDGWQDLSRTAGSRWRYERAENGNVALTGEIDLRGLRRPFVLALGFGRSSPRPGTASAGEPATTLREALGRVRRRLARLADVGCRLGTRPRRAASTAIASAPPSCARTRPLASPAAIVASLSIPWGFSKGDEDLGGYHLVWPRDLVETAGGFLACGANDEVLRVLRYLRAIQEADGHWPQNCWLDGAAYWGGMQMDECAFPILLLDTGPARGRGAARPRSQA